MSFFKRGCNKIDGDADATLKIKRGFIAVFSVLLLALVLNIAVDNSAYSCFNPIFVLPLAIFSALVFLYIYRRLDKYKEILQKHCIKVLFIVLAVILAVQIICAINLRFTPVHDLGSIYFGGQLLAQTGDLGSKYSEYFAMFSNNLGGLCIYTALAWFCNLFSIEDFYLVSVIFNSLTLCAGVGCMFLSARKMFGVPAAMFTLIALLMLPSFYTFGATIYTDVLSLPFAACSLWAYICAKQEGGLLKRTVCAIACGVLIAIGTFIKGTVAILIVVYAVDIILSGIKKHAIAISVIPVSVTCILLISILISGIVPKDLAYQKGIPWTHWVAMSAHGLGTYNSKDYANAKLLPNKDARVEADLEIIASRYKENGAIGTLNLWKSKLIRDFGNGTFSTSDFLDDSPAQNGILQKTVLTKGEHYSLFANLSQGVYLGLLLLMAIGIFFSVKDTSAFLPMLAVAGIMAFLLFWEASARYVTNYIPFMLLGAVASVKNIANYIDNKQWKKPSPKKSKRTVIN